MWQNRKSIKVIEPPSPTKLAVSVSDMKDYLRISGSDDDDLLTNLIFSSTQSVRNYCRRAIIEEVFELTLDKPVDNGLDELRLGAGIHTVSKSFALQGWGNEVDLPFPPVISVTSIKTYATDNTESTYSSANYQVDETGGRIYLNEGQVWPSNLRNRESVKIRYTAGYDPIPHPIIMAIKQHVAYMYECRQSCELPQNCKDMLSGYRLFDNMGMV